MALNYYEIQEALRNLLRDAQIDGVQSYLIEAMGREVTFDAMPLIDVRLAESNIQIRSMPNGEYEFITFEVEVVTFNFTHFEEAARLRDSILSDVRQVIRQNQKFHVAIETSHVTGGVRFGAGTPEQGGGHVALATLTVICEAYIDPV